MSGTTSASFGGGGRTVRDRLVETRGHRMSLLCGSMLLLAGSLLCVVPRVVAELPQFTPDRTTTQAALQLLNESTLVDREGRHHRLLRGLRQLEDPQLQPLFVGLAQPDRHPALQVHGILGLAEIARPRGLTTGEILRLPRPDVRSELIGAALDSDLIDTPTRKELLQWDGLPPGVKLLLALPLVAEERLEEGSPGYEALLTAQTDPALGQRALASLLLHQMGDPRGAEGLITLSQDTSPSRDAVRATLLETAAAHDLDRVRNWAYSVSRESDLSPRLEMLALETAIRFGDPRAVESWRQQVAARPDVSRRTRLALAGLDVSPWLPPEVLTPLTEDTDPFVAQIAAGAQAVALAHSGQPGPQLDRVVADLVRTGHPQVCRWAEQYTRRQAADATALSIAEALLLSYDPTPGPEQPRRLDAVVWATQTLLDRGDGRGHVRGNVRGDVRGGDRTEKVLLAALRRPNVESRWARAVLLGLIRSRAPAVSELCAQLPEFADRDAADLALNLRLRRPEPVSGTQEQTLALQIRGGTELDDSLRVQAAWGYLKRTGQAEDALAAVLAPTPGNTPADAPRNVSTSASGNR